MIGDPQVFELRQYTLKPGRRDDLVTLFDRELVASQEETGMWIVGQFRDLDRPDRFVWLRAFADMPARRRALSDFYTGPVWKEHGPAANDTMLAFDDVLLLRPAPGLPRLDPAAPLRLDPPAEPGHGLTITVLDRVPGLAESLAATGCHAVLETEPAENTYPALPVRADAAVLAVLHAPAWRPPAAARPSQVLRLSPTPGSRLTC